MLVGADRKRIELCLFTLRLGVVVVMAFWTADKFLHPEHTAKVFRTFYFFDGLSADLSFLLGCLQGGVVFCFFLGIAKRISTGAVLCMHALSTLSSYQQYLTPFEPYHLLFFAAWPMLAACFVLYHLRDFDTLLSFK